MLAAMVAALLAGGVVLPPPAPPAVGRVPDEPGSIALPDDEPTLQAVAADLDADGAPELVRVVGSESGPMWVEVWREEADGWAMAASPEIVVPGQAGQAELAYARRPVRLLVRRVGGGQHVTLTRQPDFAEPEDASQCCLMLDDVVVEDDAVRLVRVAEPGGIADAVHVIDLDGDGTDELLATYFLSPINDASTSTEARVFRWRDGRFAPPRVTELPVGSGSTAFILGDSDGVPGDEAAVISSSARSFLFRVSLAKDDALMVEDAGLRVVDALAVRLGDGRGGIAVVGPTVGLAVFDWPRGKRIDVPHAALPIDDARLLGVIEVGGRPRLLAHRGDADTLYVLTVPDLAQVQGGLIEPSPAAAALDAGSISSFEGPLPGAGPGGEAAAIVSGWLLPALRPNDAAMPVGALAEGRPAGLVGRDRAWLAIHHGASPLPEIDPSGGRLEPPAFHPGSGVTLAPLELVSTPEVDSGAYEPATVGGVALDGGVTGTTREGFVAEVRAPPGSRVYLSESDAIAAATPRVVGDGGTLDVVVEPPADATAAASGRVTMTVATPAGHAYAGSWEMRIVEGPPALTAGTATPIGSSRVTITGRTAPYAEVEVAGAAVSVEEDGRFATSVELPPWPTTVSVSARDPLGNEAILLVSGVGLFDYRALPWIPISLVLLSAVALVLILQVPKPRAEPRSIGEDATLEELDPADRL